MAVLPMFPLGSALLPHMPTILRVFEDRYLVMLSRILQEEPSEFGIVLIERGQEVGGGEKRFSTATVAQISQLDTDEGHVLLVAEGQRRIEVVEWLEDDPYPRAEVRDLPELEWDDELQPLRDRAEILVRRLVARASEFVDQPWSADVEVADEPVAAAWQLAGIAPLAELDRVRLLQSATTEELLTVLIEQATFAQANYSAE